ncbi:MAG: IS3 family transposase, partial [Erysipelothrix sp.]|nr:IS3 family transposase [Erysipelothrix sp.]
EKPVIHSDRGGHYRWLEWIEITERYGLTRSMSKKGCTADNSACEGFFGRMKNECFYDRDFSTFTMELFKNYINQYLNWYNYERITLKLKCSPMESRLQLRIA